MAWYDAPKKRTHPDVTAYINDLDPEQKAICQQVRKRLKQDPQITEFIAWGIPCYWRKGPMVYTSAAKGHVTLGFFRGMEIGLGLKGTGKSPIAKHVWKVGKPTPEMFETWMDAAVEADETCDD